EEDMLPEFYTWRGKVIVNGEFQDWNLENVEVEGAIVVDGRVDPRWVLSPVRYSKHNTCFYRATSDALDARIRIMTRTSEEPFLGRHSVQWFLEIEGIWLPFYKGKTGKVSYCMKYYAETGKLLPIYYEGTLTPPPIYNYKVKSYHCKSVVMESSQKKNDTYYITVAELKKKIMNDGPIVGSHRISPNYRTGTGVYHYYEKELLEDDSRTFLKDSEENPNLNPTPIEKLEGEDPVKTPESGGVKIPSAPEGSVTEKRKTENIKGHTVCIVGFRTVAGEECFIVQDSQGPTFGDKGFRMVLQVNGIIFVGTLFFPATAVCFGSRIAVARFFFVQRCRFCRCEVPKSGRLLEYHKAQTEAIAELALKRYNMKDELVVKYTVDTALNSNGFYFNNVDIIHANFTAKKQGDSDDSCPSDMFFAEIIWNLDRELEVWNCVIVDPKETDLSSNSISGSIPTDLQYLVNLAVLNLSANELVDEIPPQITMCAYLNVIDLHRKLLTVAKDTRKDPYSPGKNSR
ncbi:Receptor-like protein 44, partial [Linum grandiflorum]